MSKRSRRPRLIHILPPPTFEIVETQHKRNFWRISMRDEQDNFEHSVWFECRDRGWTENDVVLAGAREAQEGRALVTIQRFENNVPVCVRIYATLFAWGRWHLRRVR